MKKNTSLLIGLITVIVTIFVYLVSCQNIFKFPMCWIALSAIVLSEILTTLAFFFAKGCPKKVGAAFVCLAQTVVTFILSIVFVNIFIFAYVRFIVFYMVTLTAAIVICIVLYSFTAQSNEANDSFKQAKNAMIQKRAVVNALLQSTEGQEYKKALQQLDEALRFSDDSVISADDASIYSKLCELSDDMKAEDFDVNAAVTDIIHLINRRNFAVKNSKNA